MTNELALRKPYLRRENRSVCVQSFTQYAMADRPSRHEPCCFIYS